MRTIETRATVTEDGTLTAHVPPDVPPGEHPVVVVIETPTAKAAPGRDIELPVIHVDRWPADLSLRREDMYDDWGR